MPGASLEAEVEIIGTTGILPPGVQIERIYDEEERANVLVRAGDLVSRLWRRI
jgi:hypothetical protein